MEVIKINSNKKFVNYKEGAADLGVCTRTFAKIAKDANARYKIGRLVFVNVELFNKYMETCKIIEED